MHAVSARCGDSRDEHGSRSGGFIGSKAFASPRQKMYNSIDYATIGSDGGNLSVSALFKLFAFEVRRIFSFQHKLVNDTDIHTV